MTVRKIYQFNAYSQTRLINHNMHIGKPTSLVEAGFYYDFVSSAAKNL